ncbi:MAG: hypothetical protein JOZ60_07670, partial [Verrucomicrobia bacterium]|nr:hypothetical protein [Verrucomicrobiota bacterium]
MPYKTFISASTTASLGYLISMRKASFILLTQKMRDSRLQFLLLKWAGTLLISLGLAMCGFEVMPTWLATGFFAPGVCLCAFMLWLGMGDMFLTFAFEDERFYNLATQTHALDIFEDTEFPFEAVTRGGGEFCSGSKWSKGEQN